MKMWKKTMAMLMCATMSVGSFASCKENDGDSSGNDVTPPTAEELATAASEAYVNGAISTLENAKSFKVVIKTNSKIVTDYFGEDGETIDPELQETLSDDKSTIELVLSQDGDGVAMQMKETGVSTYSYYDGEAETEVVVTETEVGEAILKDGLHYSRWYSYDASMTDEEIAEEKAKKWELNIEGETEEEAGLPMELIEKLLGAKEVEDAYNMLIAELKGELKTKILSETVADGNFVWEYDFADDLNGAVAFIEAIDETEDTLGGVINEVLAKVAPGLTAEALLGQLKAYSKMTVAEALTSIDTLLTAEYNTTLQAIKDAIVNSEIVGILMSDEAAMALDEETIAQVKAWQFASLKEEGNEIGEAIVGDLINALLLEQGMVEPPAEGEEPADYVAEFLEMAEASLDVTFEDLGIEVPDMAGNEAKKLGGSFGVSFDTTTSALEEISFSFDAELVSYETDYDEETNEDIVVGYYTQIAELDITVSEISASAATINAPAEEDVVIYLINYESADGTLLNVWADGDDIYGNIYVCNEDGEELYWVYFNDMQTFAGFGEEMTLQVTGVGGWNGEVLGADTEAVGAYYENTDYPTITLTINADGTYEVEGIATLEEIRAWYADYVGSQA